MAIQGRPWATGDSENIILWSSKSLRNTIIFKISLNVQCCQTLPTVHLQHLALKRKQVNTREIQKSFLLKKVFYSELGTLVDELSLDGFPLDPTNICLDPTRRQIFVSLTSQLQTWIQHLSYFSNNFNVWLFEIKPLSLFQLYITKYRQECPKDNWGNAHITHPTRVG